MVVIGMGLALAGYAIGMWGYCMVRGYDVPFTAIWHSTWPGGGKQAAPAGAAAPLPLPADPGTGTVLV